VSSVSNGLEACRTALATCETGLAIFESPALGVKTRLPTAAILLRHGGAERAILGGGPMRVVRERKRPEPYRPARSHRDVPTPTGVAEAQDLGPWDSVTGAWLEPATTEGEPKEERMEFDRRSDRLPFHDPDEEPRGHVGATAASRDAQIRHLQRVPLFSGFTEDELRRVADLSRIVDVPAGTVVTQMGEPGDSFFVIIDGSVAVRTPVGAGSLLQPGDFFGEMSLLDGEPRSATIVATTDVRLAIVDRSHFWRLLDETPDLIRRILTILSRRVRRLEQTVHAILHGPSPA